MTLFKCMDYTGAHISSNINRFYFVQLILYCCLALQKFQDKHGHVPLLNNRDRHVEELKILLEEVIEELAIPRQLVTDEFTK